MNTSITSPAASPAPASTPLAQFISQNAELHGLPVEQLISALNQRLSQTPLHYANALTGTALLRAVQSLAGTDLSAHYVLLLRGWQIVAVAMIPVMTDEDDPDFGALLCAHHTESRALMQLIMQHNATKVMLATSRDDGEYMYSDREEQAVAMLGEALRSFGVEQLEYLLFYADLNISWFWARHGDEGLDTGVSIEELEYCGLPDEDEADADQSLTSTLG